MNAFPIRPIPQDDKRFTMGLALDVRNVLKAHGYAVDEMSGMDLAQLKWALYHFLYEDRT